MDSGGRLRHRLLEELAVHPGRVALTVGRAGVLADVWGLAHRFTPRVVSVGVGIWVL
jgi:hypothetical protein